MTDGGNSRRRVVITGLGLITPFGVGVDQFWRSALAGASGVSHLTHFDPSGLPSQVAAYLKDEALCAHSAVNGQEPRFVAFALTAAGMATEASAWVGSYDPALAGIFLGTSGERMRLDQFAGLVYEARAGNGEVSPKDYARVLENKVSGELIARLFPQYAAARLAQEFGIRGPAVTINTACTSSAHAIGVAFRAIQRGTVDIAIAGGTECLVSQIGMHIFSPLGVLSRRNDEPERASRPFDAERDGFVLGEGAGILILEHLDSAMKRSAPILAELAGFGTSCDAYRVTDESPDGRGAILAMRRALDDAALSAGEIDYINAHGTSTPMNDRLETRAIKAVFGRQAYGIPVSSTKSMIGHTISAAGAIELITSVLALRDRILPPTVNYEFPDPECDLDYVPNKARPARIEAALSNSFGFGGHNDCLVVKRSTF